MVIIYARRSRVADLLAQVIRCISQCNVAILLRTLIADRGLLVRAQSEITGRGLATYTLIADRGLLAQRSQTRIANCRRRTTADLILRTLIAYRGLLVRAQIRVAGRGRSTSTGLLKVVSFYTKIRLREKRVIFTQ